MQPLPPIARRPAKKRSHWFSNLLLLVGFAFVLYAAGILAEARLTQAWESYVFERSIPEHAARRAAEPVPAMPVMPTPDRGEWIGRLEVPRLDVSVMVREGDDNSTLRIAAGHLPSSALPGQIGTVAIAGHRDTFFRALGKIRTNDLVRLETHYGTHDYFVEEVKIVSPKQTDVLDSNGEAMLTLITCYPFNYVGSAPQRFVVRAKESKQTLADAGDSSSAAARRAMRQ